MQYDMVTEYNKSNIHKNILFYGRFRIVNASFTSVALSWWIHFVLLLQLFAGIYPDEEFLPKKSAPVYADDDSDSAE